MTQREIAPDNTEFVILCFEGPDPYSRAGGLGVRIGHLSVTLAQMGFPTHLFFIGDPRLKGEEQIGNLTLHRWCQWISGYYPNGVYDGENGKRNDFNDSIPWFVKERIVEPALKKGKLVAILGEEWQTAEAMCRLSDLLQDARLRDRVIMFWNANNTFSFDRIDWERLSSAATITTVSRYMKHLMWGMRLNPLVIPNGIPASLLHKASGQEARRLRESLGADLILCKVARWDPDKCWEQAVEAALRLKEKGLRTLLIARGGIEPYGQEVIGKARGLGLKVKEAKPNGDPDGGYFSLLKRAADADVIDVKVHLPLDFLRIMYRTADAVLANSGHEPFGIVGLETMAAGGVAFTGSTGEDYAIPFVNSFVLETTDPGEIVGYITYLRNHPEEDGRIRKTAMRTARYFTWGAAALNLIGKLENRARIRGVLGKKPGPERNPLDSTPLPNAFTQSEQAPFPISDSEQPSAASTFIPVGTSK